MKLPAGSPFIGLDQYTVHDASAVQALVSGRDVPAAVAKRAFDYIVDVLAATYDQSYRPDRPQDTAFAEGRRFVGLQLVKLSKLNLNNLKVTHGNANPGRDPGRRRNAGQS